MVAQYWGGASKKRGRDEDGDSDIAIGSSEGFTEHRNKRLQSLPFRNSPASKRMSFPPNLNNGSAFHSSNAIGDNNGCLGTPRQFAHSLTPADSDSEDMCKMNLQTTHTGLMSPGLMVPRPVDDGTFQHAPEMVDGYRTVDVDMDMDMDGTEPVAQVQSNGYLGTGHSQPDPMQPGSITSRMPTPIHCSFASQVRGNNWGGAAGNMLQTSGFGHPPPPNTVPRSLDRTTMSDWNLVQDRRLPSPISESGGEDLMSPSMILDSQLHPCFPPRAASAMDFAVPARTPSALSTVSDVTGGTSTTTTTTSYMASDIRPHAMDIESVTATSPKKGHARSRHTLNGWTQDVPGMKKTFSIGYRADCEKCRQKVPGHFNHIIVS
ncbi:hypothetical protein BD289DRAFT_453512 [Coniella lustricola]|uniref:Uncharacterized protein n=1 Tax=Coniella lustricola TaxID=2025994 RepID=A0A2T3A6Z9_9PEZI|nr:hypothetical protein BD289DRAFT_453512 [Coniella lustricola]